MTETISSRLDLFLHPVRLRILVALGVLERTTRELAASLDDIPVSSLYRHLQTLLDAGAPLGLKPAGLGARDTLRLEAAMPLYGHELDANTNPLECGLNRFVVLDKPEFIGRDVLATVKTNGPSKRLVGLEMLGRGIPRQGYTILKDGQTIGAVTSGTQSPTLGKAIGMAYVEPDYNKVGTEVDVLIRGAAVAARIVKRPFYKRPK